MKHGFAPIDTYKQLLWDGDVVVLRSGDGAEKLGSWGYDDESWDPETGEEWVYGAWHDEEGEPLGFDPVEWRPNTREAALRAMGEDDDSLLLGGSGGGERDPDLDFY